MFFSTKAIEQACRQDAWLGALATYFGVFKADFGSGPFDGSIESREIGIFRGLRIRNPLTRKAQQLSPEANRGVREQYSIVLQVSGHSQIEQAGRTVTMFPGNITIIDLALPSAFSCALRSSTFVVHIPKQLLDNRGVCWQSHVAKPCSVSTASLLQSLIFASFEQPLAVGPSQSRATSDAIIDLFIAGYLDECDAANAVDPSRASPALLKSIQAYIINHLHDDTLSPAAIAKSHYISERQLHRLFEPSGLSVCRWIRQARLDRCAMELRDSARKDRTITEIAFGQGFNDSAHFSRAFRDEFNQTPREYRALAARARLPAREHRAA